LASSSEDGSDKLWDVPTGAPEALWRQRGNFADPLAFSPNSDFLALGRYQALEWYELERQSDQKLSLVRTISSSATANPSDVTFDPNGSVVAMVGQELDNKTVIMAWSTKDLKVTATLQAPTGIDSVSISRGGVLAAGGGDGAVRLWNLDRGELVHTLLGHEKRVTGVAFRPQDDILASISADNSVRLWNGQTGKALETVATLDDITQEHLAFSPVERRFLAVAGYRNLEIWSRSDSH